MVKMKQIMSLLLLLCVLLPGGARAAAQAPMRLMEINLSASPYWAAHPEVPKVDGLYSFRTPPLAHLQGEKPPDLLMIRTMNDDFLPVKASGLLADLSGDARIREAVGRMHPDVQRLVTAQDGRILAFPVEHSVQPLYWFEDAWAAAGLTAQEAPGSYTELLDFLERWADNPAKGVCVTRMLRWTGVREPWQYANWLMQTLALTWTMQQQYAGTPVRYDMPAFIVLAERTREVGLRLYEAEPRLRRREGMLQLFQNDMNGGEHANGGRPYGLSHSIPYRITADQPMLMKACAGLCCVRAGSAWEAEAIEAATLTRTSDMNGYSLYADFPEGDIGGGRMVAQGWLDDLRDYEGTLFYTDCALFHNPAFDALLERFFSGALSAGELAAQMDALGT